MFVYDLLLQINGMVCIVNKVTLGGAFKKKIIIINGNVGYLIIY